MKMGQKRTEKRKPIKKRSKIKPISKKRQSQLPEYNRLIKQLRELCENRSELSGNRGDWRFDFSVVPHHIMGRVGDRLTDPFNIIFLTPSEHDSMDFYGFDKKQSLLEYIKKVRIKQGYKEQI